MTRLAMRLLRHRPGTATATLIALAVGVMILMAMGSLVESGLRYQPEPKKYATADIVVARTEMTVVGKDIGGETTRTTVRLPEPGPLPADLAGQIRNLPGVTKADSQPGAIVITGHPDRKQLDRLAEAAGAKAYAGPDRGQAEFTDGSAAKSLLVTVGASFGGYVVLLVIFVVAGTIGLSVRHRRRDLALLRAVAATPGQVRRMLVAEALLISAGAAVVGLPAGVAATFWTHDQMVSRGFLPAELPVSPGPLAALATIVLTTGVAALAAVLAARRATAIRPTEALGEAAAEPGRNGKVRLVSGLVMLAGGAGASVFAAGAGGQAALGGAIGMLYLFVAAVALLAPWINRGAARTLAPVLRAVWGPGGYLAAANLRANASGTATVLTALVLSVGFGGSVWFLQDNLQRQTATQTRDGLTAQWSLVGPKTTAAEIRKVPGVSAVTGIRETSVLVRMFDSVEPTPAKAIEPAQAESTLDLGVTQGRITDVGPGSMAVSELAASTNGWKLGETASLWLADGTPAKLRVAAIYRRGLGFGDVILDSRTAPGPFDQMLIRTEDGADLSGLPGQLLSTRELTGHIAADLATSAWLNKLLIGVMVGYAALAAANTMVMAALARGRELAVLRLAGATRRQVARMVNAEQAGLLGVAVVLGGAIAALTLTAVVHALTGDLVPYVPPRGGLVVLGGTALLALTTTVLPVRRLLRASAMAHLGPKE